MSPSIFFQLHWINIFFSKQLRISLCPLWHRHLKEKDDNKEWVLVPVDVIRVGCKSPADFTLLVCESVVSAKVNPHARGLFRLEGSVALSQHRVRDHTPTFKERRAILFPHSLSSCWCRLGAILHRKPLKAQGEIDSSRFQRA